MQVALGLVIRCSWCQLLLRGTQWPGLPPPSQGLLRSSSSPRRHRARTGPSWTVSAFAIDSGYLGVGESVSCPTPTGCVAVGRTGEEANSRAASAPSAAIEVAGTWGPFASVSDETGVEHGSLSSVSCWAAWQCVAVGLAWHAGSCLSRCSPTRCSWASTGSYAPAAT
jgi:hypothetical protein